ncbi:MAG: glycosyltransferase [Candidatus Delongbacteria bacterium]|nr:glycosyltransferase [Candidatus Delongbacteria bacterium]
MSEKSQGALPHLLLIVYDFPPFVGGGAVVRMVKLAKYLHAMGHPVTVLTGGFESRYADPGIQDELTGIRVEHAAAHPVTPDVHDLTPRPRHLRLAGMILRSVVPFPDNRFRYLPAFLDHATRLIRETGSQLVLITNPPSSMGLLAPLLRRRFPELPIVLDYRDMWALDPLMTPKTRWYQFTQKILERWTIAHADRVVSATPAYADWFASQLKSPERSLVITNGYDEADFDFEPEPVRPDKLVFAYAGTTGGVSGPWVFDSIFQAFDDLLRERPELDSRLVIRFIGAISQDLLKAKARFDCGRFFELDGFVTHRVALQRLSGCDVLINNLFHLPHTALIYPGKTFEYLRLGKPMLVTAPDGILRQLVRDNTLGEECVGNDSAQILPALRRLVDHCREPGYYNTGNPDVYTRFERGALARAYRQILMECIAERKAGQR